MDTTLSAQREFCRCYIDDVIIHSKSFDEHLIHLRAVFERLRAKRIKCHPKKMRLAVRTVPYLGHFIVPGGTAPQDVKVEAIVRMVPPRDISELRAFLGTCGYYRRYVQNYARIAAPLNRLLQNVVVWNWVTDEQKAFELLKLKLTEAPVLRRPDFTRPSELHTDWSATGLGAVLAQHDEEGKEYVVAYASRSNNRTERNYSSYHGECLAAVWGWLMTNTKLTGMHARWANILQEYDLTIVHRSGVKNLDADGLSRNPLPEDDDWTDARMDHVGLDLPAVSACLAILAGTLSEPEDPELTRLLSPDDIQAPERSLADTPAESSAEAQAERPAQPQAESPADAQALAIVAPLREAADDDVDLPVRFDREIWEDAPVMAYLEAGVYANGVTPKQKDRIWHRAQSYQLKDGVLRKRLVDSATKIVPRPELRANLIRRVHQDVGHYGVLKTYSLLSPTYWWVRMYGQVQHEVAACTVCDRVKATFDVKDPELKPLPIMGMFYRWGVDLCKMPQNSDDGNRYVVVMVEHFTKWIELRAIPAKEAKHVAAAFRDVLIRFGAPAEVVTDQGREFEGEFDELMFALYIDHIWSSRNHPQTDGLAERIVQVVKKAMRKYGLLFNKRHWDRFLQWIALGYRMSRQASLWGYSPYYMLFGRHPIVGSKVRDVLQEPVDLDDPILCAKFLHDRAELFKEIVPMAFDNLAIAQHRDILRYAHTRSGDFKPKLRRYEVGDLVYLRRQPADSLDPKVGRLIPARQGTEGNGPSPFGRP
ncbi:hypothetical protein KFL_000540030 [Klebsormidium nitens]|uniref:Integrase catalytic domain-containing protein n=1 Tax=Klebsormidium nitens TaxID=105231 RepID=A0A0U9HIL8_KLENI|nr:hypothetical protein KFL_000540030 [Klebsormidium nitens]|eukprot:GAQ80426.1 hypothetical protein KFL_000540030 [Klebsormidium nitens]